MTWAKFDDQLYTHPKLAALGHYALPCIGLNLLAVCWSNSMLTDGHIPRGQIFKLCGDIELLVPSGKPWELVNPMLDAGVWDPCAVEEHGDCYVVHDFLDYNPSREDVMALRKARSEAGSIGGSKRSSKPQANGKQTTEQNGTPVPVPDTEVPNGTSQRLSESREGIAQRVFEAWRGANGHQQARLTEGRKRLVHARLREGYSEQQLTNAVLGMSVDPWPERVQHNDLSNALRDGAHVEKFAAMWENGTPAPVAKPNPVDERIRQSFGRLAVVRPA